jgi:hypothetical protein
VRLPFLAPALRRYIALPPFSFADERAEDDDIPADFRAELRHWRRRVHIEFRELALCLLLVDLRTASRLQS